MPGGNTLKIGIIVLALCIVGYMLLKGSDEEGPRLASEEEMMEVVCLDGGKHFQMPAGEWRAAENLGKQEDGGGDGGPTIRHKRRVKVIRCDECDGGEAVLASKCAGSDKWYPTWNPDGTKGECPD